MKQTELAEKNERIVIYSETEKVNCFSICHMATHTHTRPTTESERPGTVTATKAKDVVFQPEVDKIIVILPHKIIIIGIEKWTLF